MKKNVRGGNWKVNFIDVPPFVPVPIQRQLRGWMHMNQEIWNTGVSNYSLVSSKESRTATNVRQNVFNANAISMTFFYGFFAVYS